MIYNNESHISEKIDQRTFFNIMNNNGYSTDVLSTLFDEIDFQEIDIYQFNCVLRRINKINKVPVFDMLLYFEKYFAELKKVVSILDDRTKSILKSEATKKFHIKIQECSLSDMF